MDVLMPRLGETTTNGTIIIWHKKLGDTVTADDILLEVETEKVSMEIPAQADGVVEAILVEAGETVDVGTKLAVINDPVKAPTPRAAPASPAGDVPQGIERVPFDNLRKRTAEHMVSSKFTSPHVLQAVEADFHKVDEVRRRVSEAWKAKEGFSLTYLPFVARAVCMAIAEYPKINACVRDDALLVYTEINLAIAVDLNFKGVVTPVIRNAGNLGIADLARAITDLSNRVRNRKVNPDEMHGGTYTISNSGTFGTLITAPIINQPQVAILSTDGVRKKPVVIEVAGADVIVARPVGVLAQSFDHRAFDGAYSAAFLMCLRKLIEQHDWDTELNRPG